MSAITCLCLSFLTFIYRKTKFHKIWALFNLSIAGWAFFVFLAALSPDEYHAYFLWRISHAIGIYVSIIFLHAISLYCNRKITNFIKISYCYGILWDFFIFWNNGHYLYNGTKRLFGSIYYLWANNFNFFLCISFWIFLVILGIYFLYDYSAKNKNQEGHQAKLLLVITIFGYTGGCSHWLPMMGINIYPHALIFLPTYALLLSYAIFKYQFLNFRIALEKSIIYSLLIASVSIAYLGIVLTSEKVLQNLLGYKSTPISLSAAFMIGIIIIPFRNRIQFLLDRSLFKGTQPEIAAENELLRREVTQSEKHKAVAALASGIAHEVRNPLTALKAFYEHFPQKKDDPEFIAKFTHIAGKEIGRIEGLIQQLLDFAKPSPPSFRETDINKLIEDTLDLISSKLKAHSITLNKHLKGQGSRNKEQGTSTFHLPPVTLKVDQNQIKQALLNILLNAIDAMPTGGQLAVRTMLHSSRFTINIADTGSGIAPEDLKHIFEPFFSKKASGTGLGLAITQGIIQEHGGNINVKSTVGEGTTFTIELTANQQKEE